MKDIKLNKLWSKLSIQIFFVVILPISLLLIVVTFGSMALHQDAMRSMVGERDKRTVRSASSALREQLNHRAESVQSIAIRIHEDTPLSDILISADFLLSDFDGGISIYSQEGEKINGIGDLENLNSIEDDLIKTLINSSIDEFEQPYFSEAIQDPVMDNWSVFVIAKTYDEGPVIVGVFSITSLARQTLAGTIAYEESTSMFLVDSAGNTLFHLGEMPSSMETPLSHPGVAQALHDESGTTYVEVDNEEHVIAFNPVAPTGWALVIEEPWESVASPILTLTEAGPLILVPVLLFSLGALWFSVRQIIQPLRSLEEKSSDLAWGDYESVKDSVGGIDEIKSLQESLVNMAQKVQSAHSGLKGYIAAITESQEEERKRLARELHDDTLQSVIALNQRVQLIQSRNKNEQAKDELEELQDMSSKIIKDLRRFSKDLRPLYLEDLGLVAAVEMLAQEASQRLGANIDFEKNGEERRLPDHIEIIIYRIIQEATNNILRHSEATHASITLTFGSDEVQVRVKDNGKGFAIPERPSDLAMLGHYGLLGVYERAELIGAKLELTSVIKEGTEIIISIPGFFI